MIKNIYEKWEELENKIPSTGNIVFEYYLSKKANNKMYFGIYSFKSKKVYLEFDYKAIENYNVPEITGMKISKAKAGYIDPSKAYITITNDSEGDEVFLAFTATLSDKLQESRSNSKTIEFFEETIKYYKDFFSNPNKSLSESEEQGLCGELLYLKKIIERDGQECVLNWLGPAKNKRDFVFDKKAVEIKSTLNQSETSITISNENQLDPKGLDELKLAVYTFEKDPSGHVSVTLCANEVLSLLSNVEFNKVFKSKLLQMHVDLNLYKDRNKYTLINLKTYAIDDSFPSLKKENIPTCVFNVKYKINLNSLGEYLVKED